MLEEELVLRRARRAAEVTKDRIRDLVAVSDLHLKEDKRLCSNAFPSEVSTISGSVRI